MKKKKGKLLHNNVLGFIIKDNFFDKPKNETIIEEVLKQGK